MDSQTRLRPDDVPAAGLGADHRTLHLARPVGEVDHVRGPRSAPVQLVEYGDYECPFCAEAAAGVDDLLRRRGEAILFVFRHFPLVSQHHHAFLAAVAAEAAGARGRFWEMHDRLLRNQGALSQPDLVEHARALGLDVPAFEAALGDPRHADRVRQDADSGLLSGVLGTPTFFVNGRRLEGGFREPDIEAAITAAG